MYERNRLGLLRGLLAASMPALQLAVPMIRVQKRKARAKAAVPVRREDGRWGKQYVLKGIRP